VAGSNIMLLLQVVFCRWCLYSGVVKVIKIRFICVNGGALAGSNVKARVQCEY
jgi:hypothetical protein